MKAELNFEIIYENNLDTDKFARMFNNTTQSYKFYWFEAILNLIRTTEADLTFDQIIDEMICEAWHTVTHYHLRLGPTVNGKSENTLERAINTLNEQVADMSQNPSSEEIKSAIKLCNKSLKRDKTDLIKYVPYKLLSPFFEADGLEEGLAYIRNDKRKELITYMAEVGDGKQLLYTIIDGTGLDKKVRINKHWRNLLLRNYSVITSWVQYNKAQFLQDRNPGVPGIIYKITPENKAVRKLDKVRDLWQTTAQVTGKPIREIYTGKDIDLKELSIDHFVPWSYISNDEMWNLIPMSRSLNSSKSNRLPVWDQFFVPFAKYQYYLYDLLFAKDGGAQNSKLVAKFNKCKKDNLNALWAAENLYIPGNSHEQFVNILEHNLKPIYETAQMQGYDMWRL